MSANKVTYNVGTSNKFSAFYEDGDQEKISRQAIGSTNMINSKSQHQEHLFDGVVDHKSPMTNHTVTNSTPVVHMDNLNAENNVSSNVPVYTDDNIFDTRAKARRPSRRFRGNPNGPRRFDRVSGTGRGRELKKQGEGGHNWGSVSKLSNDPLEEDQLNEVMNNLNLNGSSVKDSKTNEDNVKSKKEEKKKNDMMDYESYKLMQQSKRSNLPTFTVNDDKKVSTDQELQNDGYVKYVKKVENSKLVEKVKVINSQANSNPLNVLPNHPSSFRDRKSSKPKQKPTKSGGRIRVKAPDLADLKLFPCLDLKS
uniref:Hyaluronan / mRNA binding family, putative n=1 Tax=Theileria annulata TaxID=5874 RepID=A0A3B0MYH8_THEAN